MEVETLSTEGGGEVVNRRSMGINVFGKHIVTDFK